MSQVHCHQIETHDGIILQRHSDQSKQHYADKK